MTTKYVKGCPRSLIKEMQIKMYLLDRYIHMHTTRTQICTHAHKHAHTHPHTSILFTSCLGIACFGEEPWVSRVCRGVKCLILGHRLMSPVLRGWGRVENLRIQQRGTNKMKFLCQIKKKLTTCFWFPFSSLDSSKLSEKVPRPRTANEPPLASWTTAF